MFKNENEEIIAFPFDVADWVDFHVGLHEEEEASDAATAVQYTVDKILKLLPSLKKSTKLLVLSTDVGSSAVYIAAKIGCKVDCVCRTQKGVSKTEAIAVENEVDGIVNVLLYKYDEIPFSNQSYDFIFALDSLSKVDDKQNVFREAARMLVPEGRFVFTDYLAGLASDDESNAALTKILDRKELVLSREYARMAEIADLEKVYTRDLPASLGMHAEAITTTLSSSGAKQQKSAAKKLTSIKTAVDEMEVSWGMYIYQKRNV